MIRNFILAVVMIGIAGVVVCAEVLPEPSTPLVVIFKAGNWDQVRTLELRGGAVLYTQMSGSFMSAPKKMVDVEATEEVNAAMEVLQEDCDDGFRGPTHPPGMNERVRSFYTRVANTFFAPCMHRRDVPFRSDPKKTEYLGRTGDGTGSSGMIAATGPQEKGPEDGPHGAYYRELIAAGTVIENDCRGRSGGDEQMRQDCLTMEKRAVQILMQGPPQGVNEDQFYATAESCKKTWPVDYDSRLACIDRALKITRRSSG